MSAATDDLLRSSDREELALFGYSMHSMNAMLYQYALDIFMIMVDAMKNSLTARRWVLQNPDASKKVQQEYLVSVAWLSL